MARKKKTEPEIKDLPVAEPVIQPITETIEKNYMPYVMSVIISRAIPEIDGFKPAQRKLLYTMYEMGLLNKERTKSANVAGAAMHYNPHGDASNYETMVRLTTGNEALLHPFIDSKGSFGKHYSDMAYAAARYTEVRLSSFSQELFRGITKDAVDFIPNYDNTSTEPKLLPVSFPNILVSPNMGIAVGMASKICSFNLAEICDGTIQLLKNPNTGAEQLLDIIKAPDFSGGAYLLYEREKMLEIYKTGRGSFKLRAKYRYDKESNCIEILEIPYSTTIDIILKRIGELVKEGKLKEITDYRDEIDINGFKLALDLRRGTDPDKLMQKLFKLTTLQDDYGCNFNVIVDGEPLQLGVCDLLKEWIKFRVSCVTRELTYDLNIKENKLHLLEGLAKILLDIDLAIKIIRGTKSDSEVVPNLMEGFGIDKEQAEFVADIKLRNLNKEHILSRLKEIESLKEDIAQYKMLLGSENKLKGYIAKQLKEIKEKYGIERKTEIIYESSEPEYIPQDDVENYNVKLIFTREGYFKKSTLLSLRGNDEHKLKEGDFIISEYDAENEDELMFFTDKAQVYKAKVSGFSDTKASAMGDYVPTKLNFDEGEKALGMVCYKKELPEQTLIFVFENGKAVRIPMSAYITKAARRRLVAAFGTASPLVNSFIAEKEPYGLLIVDNTDGAISINGELIPLMANKGSSGVSVFTLKKNGKVTFAKKCELSDEIYKKYRKNKIPAKGSALDESDKRILFKEND